MTGRSKGKALISTVETAIEVPRASGYVLLIPGLTADFKGTIRKGDTVTLERPDGSIIEAEIGGFEVVSSTVLRTRRNRPILVGSKLTPDMIPCGTKIYLADGEQ